jgi:hypothetical protein
MRNHTGSPNIWVIDNDNVRKWYYREPPAVGDSVKYMRGILGEFSPATVTAVLWDCIVLNNGTTMRRPYILRDAGGKMLAWMRNNLKNTRETKRRSTHVSLGYGKVALNIVQ